MKIIQFIRNLTIYCSKFRLNERLSWNILQTAAAITTAESACPVIFALKALFYRHIQKCYLYTLDCKNVDTQQAFIMNDETQQRAIQTFPEENVLSWEKIFHE